MLLLRRLTLIACCTLAVSCLAACSGGSPNKHNSGNTGDGGDPFGNNPLPSADAGPNKPRDGGGFDSAASLAMCGASRFGAEPVQANVLLVLDKSASMTGQPAGFGTDKWSAMKASLATALDAVKQNIWLGLELYPRDHCEMPAGSQMDVDVQAGDKALPLMNAALQAASPSGGTPTAAALARALEYFTKGAGASLKGEKYVLLATDGGPNCNAALSCDVSACTVNLDNQCPAMVANCCDPAAGGAGAQVGCLDDKETLARIKDLASAGIDTFVIGIPGSESYATALDAFAQAGGRANPNPPPSYFAVRGSGSGLDGLTTVLSSVTSSLITSCRLQLASVPPSLDQLNVQVDGKLVPQQGPDGWRVDTSTAPPTIELQGTTCGSIEQHGVQTVAVLYGCPTLVK